MRRHRSPAGARIARLERLGLVATSLVLLFGLWLTYLGQAADYPLLHRCPAVASVIQRHRTSDDVTGSGKASTRTISTGWIGVRRRHEEASAAR